VRAAVAQLGYRPDAAARALASRRPRTIGLVTVGLPYTPDESADADHRLPAEQASCTTTSAGAMTT
jgi:DNA-binding LacI/PurR family transcriptional regulator